MKIGQTWKKNEANKKKHPAKKKHAQKFQPYTSLFWEDPRRRIFFLVSLDLQRTGLPELSKPQLRRIHVSGSAPLNKLVGDSEVPFKFTSRVVFHEVKHNETQ